MPPTGDMTCPNCDQPLTEHRDRGTVVWSCQPCEHLAMGVAVLRRLLTRDAIKRIWHQARGSSRTSTWSCPSCRQPMAAVMAPAADGTAVEVDVCIRCPMVWLDVAEFNVIPKPPPPAELIKGELSPKAREALAMARLESVIRRQRTKDMIDNVHDICIGPDGLGLYGPGLAGLLRVAAKILLRL